MVNYSLIYTSDGGSCDLLSNRPHITEVGDVDVKLYGGVILNTIVNVG